MNNNNNPNTDTDSVIYVIAGNKKSQKVDIDISSIDKISTNNNGTYFYGKITDLFENHVKVMVCINGIKEWIFVSRSSKRWKSDTFTTRRAHAPNDIILYTGTFVSLKIGGSKEGYCGEDVKVIHFNDIPNYQYRFFAASYATDSYYWIRRFTELQKKITTIYNCSQNEELKEFIGYEYGNNLKSMCYVVLLR